MLERLDQIDWYSLGHAYGDAADLPQMIRALTSQDKAVRDKAWYDIFGSVRHQGDIYDSTPQVVPFLIELLDDPTVPAKEELLQNICYYSPDFGGWAPYYGDHRNDHGDDDTVQTRQAIEAGTSVYLRFLRDSDSAVQSWAARLLTVCISHRHNVAGILREWLPKVADPAVRAAWVLQLGILNRREDADFFAGVAMQDSDALVRLAAALAWVHLLPEVPPEDAVRIIDESTKPPADLLSRLPKNEFVVDRAFEALHNRQGADVKVLLQLLESPTIELRKEALGKLHALRCLPVQGVRAMVNMLNDPIADVRQWTAFLLGDIGQAVIWSAKLTKDQSGLAALEVELNESAPIAVDGLIIRLVNEKDSTVRGAICRALKWLALWAWSAAPSLRATAKKRNHDAKEALDVIEKLHRADAQEVFKLAMGHEDRVSWMAGRVLVQLGRLRPKEVVPLLIEGLSSWPAAVEKSANLLGELGVIAHSAVPALQKTLMHAYDTARNAAALALKSVAPDLPSPEALIETEIVKRLGQDGTPDLLELVKRLLDDSKTHNQLRALWKISRLGTEAKPAVPFVREAMMKSWLRVDAAGALSRLDPQSVRPMIPELLRPFERAKLDGDFGDRTLIFLAYLGPELQPDAVHFLLHCLPDPGNSPRPSATMIPHALCYLDTAKPDVLLPLIKGLLQTDWKSKRDALDNTAIVLKFLKKRGTAYSGATHAVLAMLQDEELLPLLLETLSRIGSWSTVIPHIDRFLSGNGDSVEAAAKCVRRLAKAATKNDIPVLRQGLAHASQVIRKSAATALRRLRGASDS